MSSAAVVTGALRVKALNLNISSWYFDFFFFSFLFPEQIGLELSPMQTVHMNYQILFFRSQICEGFIVSL